jgi:AAA+ ATPase superfamily predicted ATPase
MVQYSLRPFPIHKMKVGCTAVCIGRRNTGKTTLLENILYNNRGRYNLGMIMSPTMSTQQRFLKIAPRCLVGDYDPDKFKRYIQFLEKTSLQQGSNIDILETLYVLDDCAFDKVLYKSKEMRKLAFNGRHFKMDCIFSVHYCMDITPDIRSNIDYMFILKESRLDSRIKLHKNFFGVISKFSDFCSVLDKCTENYECLVLDNTVSSNNPEDCLFYYKANPNLESFHLFDPFFWKCSEAWFRYNEKKEKKDSRDTDVPVTDETDPNLKVILMKP